MAKLLSEVNERILLNEDEAMAIIEDISNTDVWAEAAINEIAAFSIDNCPILLSEIRDRTNISDEVSDESVMENMEAFNIGLSIPLGSTKGAYPIGDTAFLTMLQRAGFSGSTALSCLKDKGTQDAMAPEDKAKVLNLGFNLFKGNAKVLIRDEKVRAVLSDDYCILPFSDLVAVLKDRLLVNFADVRFADTVLSHEYFSTVFTISDKTICDEFARLFKVKDLRMVVKLTTSDVGSCAASIYPQVFFEGLYRTIGNPLLVTHKDKHSLADFERKANEIYSLFKESSKVLEEMARKKLVYPAGCFKRVAKAIGLPKKMSVLAADDFQALFGRSALQIDLYNQIYEVIDQFDAETGGLTQAQKINLDEGISRVVFGNLDNYDLPFEWE